MFLNFCTPKAFLPKPSPGLRGFASAPWGIGHQKSFSPVVDASPIYRARVDNGRVVVPCFVTQGSSQSLATLGFDNNAFGVQEKNKEQRK
jgi:hypothetical protein